MDGDAGTHDEEAEEHGRFPLAVRSQRVLQIILGLFWILDAALQFQPFMFGSGFVENNILANASGQPFVLGDFITHIGNFVAPDIAVWNTFFALIQLFIGVGLLFRGTVRPALAVSFAWVLGVWVIGEGLGMLLTGTASALTGAPGSRAPLRAHRPHGLAPAAPPLGRLERPPGGRGHLGRRPGNRPHHHAAGRVGRLLVAGRRAVPAARQPDPHLRPERHRGHGRRRCRAGTPTSSPAWPTCSRPPGPRRRGSWRPFPSPSGSARWWPAGPAGSWPPARCSRS